MTRFDYTYDYDANVPWEFWNQATLRALSSNRGQQALAALERALVDLPEPKLISSRLAENGQVCAVGAYVAAKRCAAGEDRAMVLAELERASDPEEYFAADQTASIGARAGLAYTLAWRLAELNDEDFRDATPEQRYAGVLAWVRQAQVTASA